MNKAKSFIKQHKVFSIIYILLILALVSNIVNGKSFIEDIVDIGAVTLVFIYVRNSKMFSKKVIVCPNCNNNIEYGQKNCLNCGYVINEESDTINIKHKYRTGNIFMILGVCTILFPFGMCTILYAFGTLIYSFFGGSPKNLNSNVFELAFVQPFFTMTIICVLVGTILLISGIIIKKKDK